MARKIVLVTGGARGIGQAVVRRFVADGHKVYFTYNASREQAEKLSAALGKDSAIPLACDVRKKDDVTGAVKEIFDKEEKIDVLVNNAGIIRDALFLTMPEEDWREVLETNLGSVYAFSRAVARQMILQRSGRIINISSIVGELGGFGQANYSASKGAINSLTRSLAAEVASRGVTVNAVAPGMVNTDMSDAVRSAFGDKIKERVPLGYFAEPADVASIVVFLASDEARYITGQIITVDGGLSLLTRR